MTMPRLGDVFLEAYALGGRDPGSLVAAELGVQPSDDIDGLEVLVSRYGPSKVARLITFAHEWKYSDWDDVREDGSIPDVSLCREAFAGVPIVGLFRGVTVSVHVPAARWPVGSMQEISLPRRSVSSWTSDEATAREYSYEGTIGAYGDEDPESSLLLRIERPGDAVVLAVDSASGGAPGWYRELYRSYLELKGARGMPIDHEGASETILSLRRVHVSVAASSYSPSDDRSAVPRRAGMYGSRAEYDDERSIAKRRATGKVV